MVVMFHLVCAGWLLFRADSMGQVWCMLSRILCDFSPTPLARYALGMVAFHVLPLMALEFWLFRSRDMFRLTKVHWAFRAAVYCYLVLMLLVCQPMVHSEFIYFQF